MRVLIADDELAVRSSISRALELKGYHVGTAADGTDALRRLREEPFDAVVLDLMMPAIDGLEVCRRMRAERDGTPILMLTARDAVGDRVAGLDAGVDDYLVKPFGGGVAALEALIALRGLAEQRLALELITPTAHWDYRPLAVAEPFGLGEVKTYDLVQIARDHGAALHLAGVGRSTRTPGR